MPEVAAGAGLLTYEDAAHALGIQVTTIKQLVYRDVLHPVKVPGSQYKLLSRAEIDWYDRRRQGTVQEPNPYIEEVRAQQAAAALQTLQPVEDAQLAELPPELSGFAVLILVFVLLLALLANRKPDPQKLEKLRSTPELQPVRRAILKLASEIAA